MRRANSAKNRVTTTAKVLILTLLVGMFQFSLASGPANAVIGSGPVMNAPTIAQATSITKTSAVIPFISSDTTTATAYMASVYTDVSLGTLLETATVSGPIAASTSSSITVSSLTAATQYWVNLIAVGDGTTSSDSLPSSTINFTTLPATSVITHLAIAGVKPPVTGAVPDTSTVDAQFTGTITWSGSPTTFPANTVETATITLTPSAGYTLTGVLANTFTVAGATATNSADSGIITAVFPATARAQVTLPTISGIAPVAGGTKRTTITSTAQYTGSITWNPNDATFISPTIYTAIIQLTATANYSFTGLASSFFTVSGATTTTTVVNSSSSATVTAVFPAVVAVIPPPPPPGTTLSNDATLVFFYINGVSVLNSTTVTKVAAGVTSVTVLAIPTNAKAFISVIGATGLVAGNNLVTVRVIAEDGVTTRIYTSTVQVTASSNTSLSVFKINGINVLGTATTLSLPAGTTSLSVVATAVDSTSRVAIAAPTTVTAGNYPVIATVVAADGTIRVFRVDVSIPTLTVTPSPTPTPTATATPTPTPTPTPTATTLIATASILKNPYVSIAKLGTKKKGVLLLGANTKGPVIAKGTALTFTFSGNKTGAFLMIRVQTPIKTFFSVTPIKTDSELVTSPAITFAKAGAYLIRVKSGTIVKLVSVRVK